LKCIIIIIIFRFNDRCMMHFRAEGNGPTSITCRWIKCC